MERKSAEYVRQLPSFINEDYRIEKGYLTNPNVTQLAQWREVAIVYAIPIPAATTMSSPNTTASF